MAGRGARLSTAPEISAIGADTLTPVVARVLGSEAAQVLSFAAEPISYRSSNPISVALVRFRGTASVSDEVRPWSVVLKATGDPGDAPFPRVQLDAATLAKFRDVAGVLRRCSGVERTQGPLYEADPTYPGHLELRRFVLLTAGAAGSIREAIAPLDPGQLAWIHGPYAETRPGPLQIRLASITSEPRRVRERVMSMALEIGRALVVDAMTRYEWGDEAREAREACARDPSSDPVMASRYGRAASNA